eukprot:1397568-Alexandrium_andersonii.AAC.1
MPPEHHLAWIQRPVVPSPEDVVPHLLGRHLAEALEDSVKLPESVEETCSGFCLGQALRHHER